jgi:hypothetical protein
MGRVVDRRGLRGFKMSVRFAPRLLSDSRARGYQVEPSFATSVVTVLGSVLAAAGRGPGRIGGCAFPSLISLSRRS